LFSIGICSDLSILWLFKIGGTGYTVFFISGFRLLVSAEVVIIGFETLFAVAVNQSG
jgi:hypothetical protein